MEFLATKLQFIKPSPTVAVTAKANELKQQGHNIIGLGAGEPDFNTPAHIINAAHQAALQGKTKYAPPQGLAELRQAVVNKLSRDNGLSYDSNQITIGVGAKQLIFNAFMATLNIGDEVIIPTPYWVSYVDIVSLFEGIPVIVEGKEADGFKMTPDALEQAITPNTKWLLLNNPSNPTGAVYNEAELKALGEVLARYPHVHIIADEIYEFLVYDNVSFTSFGAACPHLYDRSLIINGVSKAYCMTGWRVGYAAGEASLIKAMNMLQSQQATSTSTLSQWAAVAALEGDHNFIADNNTVFARRRNFVVDGINAIDGLSVATPNGAFYVYVSCHDIIGKITPHGQAIASDEDFVQYLLADAGIAVVHGAAFGASPYFRISYATSDENLHQAIGRIKEAVGNLR